MVLWSIIGEWCYVVGDSMSTISSSLCFLISGPYLRISFWGSCLVLVQIPMPIWDPCCSWIYQQKPSTEKSNMIELLSTRTPMQYFYNHELKKRIPTTASSNSHSFQLLPWFYRHASSALLSQYPVGNLHPWDLALSCVAFPAPQQPSYTPSGPRWGWDLFPIHLCLHRLSTFRLSCHAQAWGCWIGFLDYSTAYFSSDAFWIGR